MVPEVPLLYSLWSPYIGPRGSIIIFSLVHKNYPTLLSFLHPAKILSSLDCWYIEMSLGAEGKERVGSPLVPNSPRFNQKWIITRFSCNLFRIPGHFQFVPYSFFIILNNLEIPETIEIRETNQPVRNSGEIKWRWDSEILFYLGVPFSQSFSSFFLNNLEIPEKGTLKREKLYQLEILRRYQREIRLRINQKSREFRTDEIQGSYPTIRNNHSRIKIIRLVKRGPSGTFFQAF